MWYMYGHPSLHCSDANLMSFCSYNLYYRSDIGIMYEAVLVILKVRELLAFKILFDRGSQNLLTSSFKKTSTEFFFFFFFFLMGLILEAHCTSFVNVIVTEMFQLWLTSKLQTTGFLWFEFFFCFLKLSFCSPPTPLFFFFLSFLSLLHLNFVKLVKLKTFSWRELEVFS